MVGVFLFGNKLQRAQISGWVIETKFELKTNVFNLMFLVLSLFPMFRKYMNQVVNYF